MSYDITLYQLKPGADIEEVAEMDLPPEGKPETRPIVPLKGKVRKDVESVIAAHFPNLDGDQGEDLGLEIEAYGSEVGIGVAYWHKGKKAQAVLQQVWNLLSDLEGKCGLSAYDPQLGKGLNLKRDFKVVVKGYGSVDS